MSRERWGTFSVSDHQRPRAFVAEVLLYDRLIIPFPPDKKERDRWEGNKWKPDLQEKKLKILGDSAVRVPWDENKQQIFENAFTTTRAASFDIKHIVKKPDGYEMTRKLLTKEFLPELPYGVSKVWAVTAFPSLVKYQKASKNQQTPQYEEELAMVLSNRFLIPEDPGKSDDELLKKAVQLSKREDFKENRIKFYKWQEDIIEQGITDKKAIEEMEQYLQKYNEVVKKRNKEVRLKFAFLAIKVGLSVPGIILGQVEPIFSNIIDIVNYAKFERKLDIDAGDCEAAAMIYDVHKKFKKS
jgi:hypothetical protein